MSGNYTDALNLNEISREQLLQALNTDSGEIAVVRRLIERVTMRENRVAFTVSRMIGPTLDEWIKETFREDVFADSKDKGYRNVWLSWPLFAHWVFMSMYPNHPMYSKYADKIHRKFAIDKYLAEADKAAEQSKCRKLHVGAVLVRDGKVVKKGWNGHPTHTRRDDICQRMDIAHATQFDVGYCIHAERNLINVSTPAQLRKGIVYITTAPCRSCVKDLIQAEVPLVIFRVGDRPTGGPELAWDLGGKTRFYGV
jgi:dCMP deaminase